MLGIHKLRIIIYIWMDIATPIKYNQIRVTINRDIISPKIFFLELNPNNDESPIQN
jgi:hypothetical protein